MLSQKIVAFVLAGALSTPSSFLFSQNSPFISFEVQPATGCSILVQWDAFPGMDTLNYEVEKSRDKQNWEIIAHKNVRSSHQYFTIDNAPGDSLNYYRVKQVGYQNRFFYSEIKWVQVNVVTDVFIWPNPARDIVCVKTPFLSGGIDLTDASGRLIRKIVIADFITEISTVNLAKGIYFLQIRSGNRVLTEKFIKQ